MSASKRLREQIQDDAEEVALAGEAHRLAVESEIADFVVRSEHILITGPVPGPTYYVAMEDKPKIDAALRAHPALRKASFVLKGTTRRALLDEERNRAAHGVDAEGAERLVQAREELLKVALQNIRAVQLQQVDQVFRFVELLAPKRIADEELGDAWEEIAALVKADAPPWRRWVKVGTTVLWFLVNVVRHVAAALLGKKVG